MDDSYLNVTGRTIVCDDKLLFDREEAWGMYEVVTRYLRFQPGPLPALERQAIGKLMSEIQYTLESRAVGPDGAELNVVVLRPE